MSETRRKVDTRFWDERRGIIRTRKGGGLLGQGVVFSHGYSLLDELVGSASFFQVMMLNVTGRLPSRPLADWVEATFICLSWPDPRIWCNQIGSLSGTVHASPVAGVGAGVLASDSRLYGPGTVIPAVDFITGALRKRQAGGSIESILEGQCRRRGGRPQIPGYARPVAKGDERITAMQRVSSALGFDVGDHLALAYEIERLLLSRYDEGLNLAGYIMAFLSDQGLHAEQIYRIYSLCVHAGVLACYAEARDRPPESFLPLRCDDIDYQGKPPRPLPKSGHKAVHPVTDAGPEAP